MYLGCIYRPTYCVATRACCLGYVGTQDIICLVPSLCVPSLRHRVWVCSHYVASIGQCVRGMFRLCCHWDIMPLARSHSCVTRAACLGYVRAVLRHCLMSARKTRHSKEVVYILQVMLVVVATLF